jgi:hypothetical protein
MAGGAEEQAIIWLFKSLRREFVSGDSYDDEDAPRFRNRYPREAKLHCIRYAKETWVENPNGTLDPITRYQVAKNLFITPTMVKNWIGNEKAIENQKRGTYKSMTWRTPAHPAHDLELNMEFELARSKGRRIDRRWFLRYSKMIYRKLHPERCIQDEKSKKWRYLKYVS